MANIKVANNIYLKSKTKVLQVNRKYRGNKLVGYTVDSVDLKTKRLRPKTIKTFKEKKNALKFARNK